MSGFERWSRTDSSSGGHPSRNGQGQLRGTLHISQRPAEATDRAVPGHWEGDLLVGQRGTQIATLVERQSRFVLLARLPAADSATVVTALVRRVQRLRRRCASR